jgi:hypothetical protein
MDFNEFKDKVENWARVRGIYEESTEAHQQAKALEEIGEYLTAETDEERMDAIGDIAVCIVNAAYFTGEPLKMHETTTDYIGCVARSLIGSYYMQALCELKCCARYESLGFNKCLEAAWNEIKDRKGMMVDGKYVKWENLTDEQREEFERRDHANTLIRQ